jgi:uncharacterized protein (TIGR02246 family)
MTHAVDPSDRAALEAIVARLEAAWNAGDGRAFAAPFSPDADFVTIRAEHFRGREAIAQGHDAIFRTIYAGSVNHYTIGGLRLLRPDVALVHVHAMLNVPSGPVAGRHSARFSLVAIREAGSWQIASFHNTLKPFGS